MTEPAHRRVATIVHAALTLGVITFGAIVLVLPARSASVAPDAVPLLRIVAIVLAAGALVAVNVLRLRVTAPGAAAGPAEWQAALGRAVVIWGMSEGVALVGCVFWLLWHDPVLLLPFGIGLVLLVLTRPAVLLEP